MIRLHSPVAAGHPRFQDSRASQLLAGGDAIGAWMAAARGRSLEQVLPEVDGDFAIALADSTGRVCLATDRFGIRSLCYRVQDGVVHAAERADLLVGPDPALDVQALFDYLYFHVIPSPRTVYSGVSRVTPGRCVVFDGASPRVETWWRPRFEEDRSLRFEDAGERFRLALLEAVRQRTDAARPACFLSGGTDSSTIAGMLARLEGPQPDTYSIGFDAEGYDEMDYARLAARHFGTNHHEYYVKPDDLIEGIPRLAAFIDQPFGNSSCLPAWCCARMAREDGVERLLAGDGGDELFGGNARYAKQRLFGHYDQVPAWARSGLVEPLVNLAMLQRVPLVRKAASYVEQARAPMPDRLRMYNLIMRVGPESVLTPHFLAQVSDARSLELQRDAWRVAPEPCSALHRELVYDWRFTLAESDLPKVNAACGLAGMEVDYPMLDAELLQLALQLPSDWKLRKGALRWFFKEALRGFLPTEIIDKKKHGFGLPFGVWTLRTPGLLSLATDSLHGLVERRLLRRDFVRPLLEQRLAEFPGYYGEMVWILMMLEQWLRARAPAWRLA